VFLSTHYGKPMDWTEKKAQEAEAVLRKWRLATADVAPAPAAAPGVIEVLADDLNTPGVISELHALARAGDWPALLASARLIGLLTDGLGGWDTVDTDLGVYATALTTAREAAMASKDFAEVDRLKAALLAAGVEVRMSKAGVELVPGPAFDASKLEAVE
ncbi:MAG: cysteine--tRNA ligase, partial [Pseudomonadota bacterium]